MASMIRTFFWLVLLINLALFAFLEWGSALMQENIPLQPPLNAEQIKLLGFSPPAIPSGVMPASVSASASQAAGTQPPLAPVSTPASAPVATPPSACLEWGEFSGVDLAHANDDLAGLRLGAKLTQREVEHTIGYWVYIPPVKKHAELNKRIAQLKKLGVNDFFVVQEKGKWQDAISLGIFKTQDVAKKFLDRLKAKGVKSAVMGERQTRLKFTVFVLNTPEAATLSKLADWQRGFTGIEMKSVACN